MICRGKEHFVQCIIAVRDIFFKFSYSFKIITCNPELTEKKREKKRKERGEELITL